MKSFRVVCSRGTSQSVFSLVRNLTVRDRREISLMNGMGSALSMR